MTTNPTQRHTARPSRSRVMRARVSAFVDRHDDAITLSVLAFVVVIVSALMAIGLAHDYGVSVRESVAIAVVIIAMGALSGAFAYIVGSERASRRVSRRYSRYMNEQRERNDNERARVRRDRDSETQTAQHYADYLNATIATLTSERDKCERATLSLRADIETERRAHRDTRWLLGTARDQRDGLAYVLGSTLDGVGMRDEIADKCETVTGLAHHAPSADPDTLANACDLIYRNAQDAYLSAYDA